MAINTYSDPNFDANVASQDKSIGNLQNTLYQSPTAYTGDAAPTIKDTSLEVKINTLKAARDKMINDHLKNTWYGPASANKPDEGTANVQPSFLEKGLDALSQPLYGVVGAAKYLTGKSNQSDIFSAASQNMTTDKETFGGLLRKLNVPAPVSAPLGFAMDLAGDPINWLTLGGEGLLGKTIMGAKKAGIEGAVAGAKAGSLGLLSNIVNAIPGATFKNQLGEYIANAAKAGLAEDSPEFIDGIKTILAGKAGVFDKALQPVRTGAWDLTKSALKSQDTYEKITGETIENTLQRRYDKVKWSDQLREVLGKSPLGSKLIEGFDYDPRQWQQIAQLKQSIMNTAQQSGNSEEFIKALYAGGDEQRNLVLNAYAQDTSAIKNKLLNSADVLASGDRSVVSGEIEKIINSGKDLAFDPSLAKASTVDNVWRALGESDINKDYDKYLSIIKNTSNDKSGVDFLDNAMNKFRGQTVKFGNKDIEYGKNILKAYDIFIGTFKKMKLGPFSPASMTYAAVGNAAMGHLMGFDIANPGYLRSIMDGVNLQRGGAQSLAIGERMLKNKMINSFMQENPILFKELTGINPHEISIDNFRTLAMQKLGTMNLSEEEAKTLQFKANKELSRYFNNKELQSMTEKTTPSERVISGAEELDPWTIGTGATANETLTPNFVQFSKDIHEKARKGDKVAQILDYAFKKSKMYEIIDQGYKLGTFLHLVENGVTRKELNIIARTVKINPAVDLVKTTAGEAGMRRVGAETYYKIAPMKASEIANSTYMNYAALPSAVKVMRSLPIIGMPFASFPYVMGAKTIETALHNPSSFNKINFLLKEVQGDRGPLEKESLNSPYYSWYKNPGMVSLPFFKDNPIYLNLTNAIPIYGQNMFNPSERKYGGGVPDQIANAADKLPIFQDPIGQLLRDFIIMPALIRDYAPQNQFGGPLYPSDATGLQKAGYAVRSLGEAMTPGILGTAGMVGAALPDSVIEKIPSYGFRKSAYAWKGETPLGIQSKEPGAQRGLRALLSSLGVNTQTMDTTYISNQIKKQINKK